MKNKITKSILIITVFGLISKIFGLLRESLIAYRFGSSRNTDIYVAALAGIGLISGLLGPAITTTLIPVLSEIKNSEKEKGSLKISNIFNVVLVGSILLTIIGYFFSPIVVSIVASGFDGEQRRLAIELTKLGIIAVIFTALASLLTVYLNSAERFFSTALLGVVRNIVFLSYLLFASSVYSIEGLMVINIISIATSAVVLVPELRIIGYKHKIFFDFKDKYLKKVFILAGPVYFGTILDELNIILDRTMASSLNIGSISALNYANILNSMFFTLFILTISAVYYPIISNAYSKNDVSKIKEMLGSGSTVIVLIGVPITVFICILATPLVDLVYRRGEFDLVATHMTSRALIFYALGLVPMGISTIITRIFYAYHDTKTPMKSVVLSLSMNLVLNLALIRYLGHAGLALATSITLLFVMIYLVVKIGHKIGHISIKIQMVNFIKSLIASLVTGGIVKLIFDNFLQTEQISLPHKVINIGIASGIGFCIYICFCILLRIKEITKIVKKIIQNGKFSN